MQAMASGMQKERKVSYKFQDAESTWETVTTGAMNSYTELDGHLKSQQIVKEKNTSERK